MMRHTTFGILCIWALLGACTIQRKNESDRDQFQTAIPYLSPVITTIENLPDSLKPVRMMLRSTPIPIKVPISGNEAYEFADHNNNTRKIIPPKVTERPTLQDETGQPVFDREGNKYLLGEGGFLHLFTYTTDNGLALDNITSSMLDESGNLWFGTWGGGISRFDGISIINFNTAHGLSNNLVHCLAQDAHGNIWIGTDGGGVSIYDGYAFSHLSTLQGLPNDIVYGLTADSKGNMWIATGGGGASKYDGTSFYNYNPGNGLPGNSIIQIAEDKNGQIWFATGNDGITRYDGSSFTHFTTEDGLADNAVNCITVDTSGSIWIGTRGGGVSKYQQPAASGDNVFTNFTMADGLGHHQIW